MANSYTRRVKRYFEYDSENVLHNVHPISDNWGYSYPHYYHTSLTLISLLLIKVYSLSHNISFLYRMTQISGTLYLFLFLLLSIKMMKINTFLSFLSLSLHSPHSDRKDDHHWVTILSLNFTLLLLSLS